MEEYTIHLNEKEVKYLLAVLRKQAWENVAELIPKIVNQVEVGIDHRPNGTKRVKENG